MMKRNWTREELIKWEKGIADLFEQGKINAPVHLSGGNENELISIFDSIEDQDYVLSGHRNHYHYLLKGGDPDLLKDEILGLPTGICKGKGRSMHVYDASINFYTSGIVGGMCAVAVGIGLAVKKKATTKGGLSNPHVWCFVGDGGEDTGHYVEAVRYADGRELPVTFVVEDNDLAVESSKEDRWKNHIQVQGMSVFRYKYERKWPHVGVGKFVSM